MEDEFTLKIDSTILNTCFRGQYYSGGTLKLQVSLQWLYQTLIEQSVTHHTVIKWLLSGSTAH